MNFLSCMFLFGFFLTLIVIGPLLLIWSLNTLFGLAIPFTLKTWAASACIGAVVGNRGTVTDKNKS